MIDNKIQDFELYNERLEKDILGFILLNNKILENIENDLNSEYFYLDNHSKIYNGILNLLHNGKQADIITVFYEVESKIDSNKDELRKYIENLVDFGATSVSSPKELVSTLHYLYIKRNFLSLSKDIVGFIGSSSPNDIDENIDEIERKIFDIANESSLKQPVNTIAQYVSELQKKLTLARKNNKSITGLKTNLHDLDNYTGGFQKSDLIIIAARPSMGKTALAVTIARNAAKIIHVDHKDEKHGIALFSLEMSGEQIAARIVAMQSHFSTKVIHTGRKGKDNDKISDSEFMNIVNAFEEVNNIPLYIDDTPALSMPLLRSRCRYLKRRHNISAIFIDYLQLLRPAKSHSQGNRVLEVAEITSGLKAIAKELDIPVIALSQLSRAVEGREDKKPQLSDLRESGTIEQDADIVMFLYRESYYMERQEKFVNDPTNSDEIAARDKWLQKYEPVKNLAELMIAKNRNGPIGNLRFHFNRETMEFTDLANSEITKIETKKDFLSQNENNEIDEELRNIFKK